MCNVKSNRFKQFHRSYPQLHTDNKEITDMIWRLTLMLKTSSVIYTKNRQTDEAYKNVHYLL